MIGLVLVSHSAQLAEGVLELVTQMTQGGKVAVATAGGIDDIDNPIGTDPMRVVEAINTVYSDHGVVILMDLGSALMSAETALEFLEPEQRENVYLSEAPFVEGALSAAVQAASGSSIQDILETARTALAAKQKHLASATGGGAAPPPSSTAVEPPANAERLEVTVPNKLGLHARPAARLVSLAGQYKAQLMIQKGEQYVSARNINQVTLLDARQGDQLVFFAEGEDANPTLQAVQKLVADNFGDRDNHAPPPAPEASSAQAEAPENVLVGVGAARGLAVGTVFMLDEQPPDLPTHMVEASKAEAEVGRFQEAVRQASAQLKDLTEKSAKRIGNNEAAIFEAHMLILQDHDLHETVKGRIQADHQPAEVAWWQAVGATAEQYRSADNPYIQARAVDVMDVGRRVLRQLSPNENPMPTFPPGSILAAPDLTPSDTAQLDPEHVQGILTQHGGATSHTAIIARSLGIPAVVGLGAAYTQLEHAQQVVVDGDKGWVHPRPTATDLKTFQEQIDTRQQEQEKLLKAARNPAITTDGYRVEVAANVGNPAETAGLASHGAEGVGLFRTELLFMGRSQAPDEEQQFQAYSRAVENLGDSPVIIRTLDVGGDKPISYIQIDPEENPFLGHRGVRYWLSNEKLARIQLRAICRASAIGDVRVMFPMVGTLAELHQARQLLAGVQAELKAEGADYDPNMQVGIMIEVPAAVLSADSLAREVDFFSVGTNDLTQYLMAADRGNAQVSPLVTPFQPAVLRAIRQVIEAAHAHGKWVGMCGEMAGDLRATPLLLGLGLDELSMSAPSIPGVKAKIRQCSRQEAQALTDRVLKMKTAADVLAALEEE